MNAPVATPVPPAARPNRSAFMERRDREFLPAALEILETPPAVLPVAMALTICAFLGGALAWAWFGKLDIYAVAPGKIEVIGHAKVIQPLSTGRVAEIAVANGAHVKAGQVLLRLDPTLAAADEKAATDAYLSSRAEVERRRAAAAFARALLSGADAMGERPIVDWTAAIPQRLRDREQAVLDADAQRLTSQLDTLQKQAVQKQAEIGKLTRGIAAGEDLIATLKDRVDLRQSSIRLNVGARTELLDAQEALKRAQQALVTDQGSLDEAEKSLGALLSQASAAIAQFLADNETQLARADHDADAAREQAVKAANLLHQTELASPVDGTVQQLAVTTIGQVVSTGQHLMTIVPDNAPLVVEALANNQDIGFVKVGQEVTIKIDAFPFTRFGTVTGRVQRISSDALTEADATRLQADPATYSNGSSSSPSAAAGQPQSYVFPITVALDRQAIGPGPNAMSLTPGMTVSAEVNTGRRSVLDYLLSPLRRLGSTAMTER